ncbi:hypothetical protein SDC9_196330 [bioreactor metagenome]|uniref:Uncharacterized protein n=1 Tax=bioreactor metagenome TaxID=1076179 RepID=A0A645IBQ5_9ZZZZ
MTCHPARLPAFYPFFQPGDRRVQQKGNAQPNDKGIENIQKPSEKGKDILHVIKGFVYGD